MKIALVCFNLSWQAGGVRLIYEEAHALKRLGHAVTLYTPEFDEQVYPELWRGIDIRVVRPAQPLLWQYANKGLLARIGEKREQIRRMTDAARRIAAAIDADTDLVNVHDFAYRVVPFLRLRNSRTKVVWYMADPPYQYLPKTNMLYDLASRIFNAYADMVERRAFAHLDAAVTLVKRNQAWLETRGVRTSIIWTGIDAKAFSAAVRVVRKEEQLTLMSVGALNKYRRFEDAIESGDIERWQGARGIKLLKRPNEGMETVMIPLVGEAPAGPMMVTEQNITNWIRLPKKFLKPAAETYFLLRVRGNSMNKAEVIGGKIEDGDLVLIRQESTANAGDIIVALIDGAVTIKRLIGGPSRWMLKPETTEEGHYPIVLDERFRVQGIVTMVVKNGAELLEE